MVLFERNFFTLEKTLNEFFKLDSSIIIQKIHKLSDDNFPKFSIPNFHNYCVFEIDSKEYVAIVYNTNNSMIRLAVVKLEDIKTKKDIKNKDIEELSCLNVELDFSHQLLLYIEYLKKEKHDKELKETQNLYDVYKKTKNLTSEFRFSVMSSQFYIPYDVEFVAKILNNFNIDSSKIIETLNDELLEKSNFLKNCLKDIFNNISDCLVENQQYYGGDNDYNLVLLEKSENKTIIGYNNVCSFDEYFILLEKKGDCFRVISDSFSNLEKIKGYKNLEMLNAFEENKNTDLIKKMNCVYVVSDNKYSFSTNFIEKLFFGISDINYTIKNFKI